MVSGVEQPAVKDEKRDDNRKSNKPIMEKRRRARINNCLNELKALILDTMKKDPASNSKLEKADILEMTVKHLGGLRSGAPDRFRAGYRRCLSEVARFPGLEMDLRKKLVRHLEGLVPGARITSTPPTVIDNAVVSPSTVLTSGYPSSRVHLVPTRLANGDIAFLLPASMKNILGSIPTPEGALGTISSLAPLSPASSMGSPPPADLGPQAIVTRETHDIPWRPW